MLAIEKASNKQIKLTFKLKKMSTKQMFSIASVVILLAFTLPASSGTIVKDPSQTSALAKKNEVRGAQLLQRLEEIKAISKSTLTRQEKKSLRKEVREIKKEMAINNGGVYLSVGAIIIIILLLILIL
jgi:uncharacterized protein (DUF3084 family)